MTEQPTGATQRPSPGTECPSRNRPRRIVVVGTSGSGKTTMAAAIAARLGMPHVELDALHWEPNWVEAPREVLRERITHALAGDAWVVDGNYHSVRDLTWPRADTIVWLDYSLPVIMGRMVWRTVRRAVVGTELWNGNRESLRKAFFTHDSIILWALQTYRLNRRRYPLLFAAREHWHLHIVHLRSPRAAQAWLETLGGTEDDHLA